MSEDLRPPPELVAGKYQLTRLLGRGGMGSVWEGVHTTLGTRVACKFIETEYAGSSEARERFENEARAAASLRSKHVVEVYDHGVMGDGRPYIVMEFLQGEPLDSRLDRRRTLSVAEVASILQQVARALTRAHAAGIVHRDLKPENVFLVWDEEDHADIVKVVDFGIAKFTDGSLGISSQTRTGSLLGTPYYMSPEQARGLRSVDGRSDLWSLAVISYRCLTGHLPFTGEAIGDLLVRICTSEAARPSSLRAELPEAVDSWMARALEREPERRFQSAKEMADAFSAIAGAPASSGQREAFSVRPGGGVAGSEALSATAGALTNAAFERDARTGRDVASSTSSSSSNRRWLLVGGAAALALLGVVALVSIPSGGAEDAAGAAQSARPEPEAKEAVSAAPAAEPAPTTEPAPMTEPAKDPAPRPEERQPAAAAPAPAQAPSAKSAPKPAPTSAPTAARPRPVASPAVAPRPSAPRAPTPRRGTDDDLGY